MNLTLAGDTHWFAEEEVGHRAKQRDRVDQRAEDHSHLPDELNVLDTTDDALHFRFDMCVTRIAKRKAFSPRVHAIVRTYKTSISIMI